MALASPSLWFLPFAVVIGAWVAWADLTRMKIPNRAVLATLALFFVLGLFLLPLDVWAWRWAHFGAAILLGFVLSMVGAMGAGDAKFLAAILPFVALRDLGVFALILAVCMVVTFAAHRVLRRLPAVRARAEGWESLDRREFPMGIALAPAWVAYLAISASGA